MTTPPQPGHDPQDWQNPSNPYGPPPDQDPYGRQQHGGPPPGYDPNHGPDPNQQYGYYPPPGPGPYQNQYGYYPPGGYPPRQEGPRTHAIVGLVVSLVLALSCYVSLGGIAGAILSGIALSKVDTQPDTARRLLKWTWVSIGINVGLLVIGIGTLIYFGANGYLD
ncbi:MgtC/SapB family protein [Sphaerimonospora sp. CA-214678]|uniref:MgtC/SapB family protein n=1 Tax=Sphaerimonospora sp. CA-214678 TaxID=3240029 RepID=UPI003D8AB955